MKNKRCNVVMIVADQVSARVMSYMGNPQVKTPNIDKIGQEKIQHRTFELKDYFRSILESNPKFNLKTPGYSADSVKLYYPAHFEGIAMGKLED